MVGLFAFEFIEGNTITRLYFRRLRRLAGDALEHGTVSPALEQARRRHLPTFTHFLDLPTLFVIVALGAIKPYTWSLFLIGTTLAVCAAMLLTRALPATVVCLLCAEAGKPGRRSGNNHVCHPLPWPRGAGRQDRQSDRGNGCVLGRL